MPRFLQALGSIVDDLEFTEPLASSPLAYATVVELFSVSPPSQPTDEDEVKFVGGDAKSGPGLPPHAPVALAAALFVILLSYRAAVGRSDGVEAHIGKFSRQECHDESCSETFASSVDGEDAPKEGRDAEMRIESDVAERIQTEARFEEDLTDRKEKEAYVEKELVDVESSEDCPNGRPNAGSEEELAPWPSNDSILLTPSPATFQADLDVGTDCPLQMGRRARRSSKQNQCAAPREDTFGVDAVTMGEDIPELKQDIPGRAEEECLDIPNLMDISGNTDMSGITDMSDIADVWGDIPDMSDIPQPRPNGANCSDRIQLVSAASKLELMESIASTIKCESDTIGEDITAHQEVDPVLSPIETGSIDPADGTCKTASPGLARALLSKVPPPRRVDGGFSPSFITRGAHVSSPSRSGLADAFRKISIEVLHPNGRYLPRPQGETCESQTVPRHPPRTKSAIDEAIVGSQRMPRLPESKSYDSPVPTPSPTSSKQLHHKEPQGGVDDARDVTSNDVPPDRKHGHSSGSMASSQTPEESMPLTLFESPDGRVKSIPMSWKRVYQKGGKSVSLPECEELDETPATRLGISPAKRALRSGIQLYNRRSFERIGSVRKCDDKFCRWQPDIDTFTFACERCWTLASRAERDDFIANGRHLRIALTKGGCSPTCTLLPHAVAAPSKMNEGDEACEGVLRLCQRCFNDMHHVGIRSRIHTDKFV